MPPRQYEITPRYQGVTGKSSPCAILDNLYIRIHGHLGISSINVVRDYLSHSVLIPACVGDTH